MSSFKLYGVLQVRESVVMNGRYGRQTFLALSLIESCTEQLVKVPGGKGMDPAPFFALCDLTDECGLSSILREEVEKHFGFPLSACLSPS